jgi:hypothetical protein
MRTLAIGNITEFNQNNVHGPFAPAEWEMWRRAGDELADMAAFWGGDETVLLVPGGGDRSWVAHVEEQMGSRVVVVEPRRTTGNLLEDVLLDADAMAQLATLGDGGFAIEPWGATPGLLRLDAALRASGVVTQLVAPTHESLWTVGYLESKLAVDDMARWIPDLHAPRSHTATTFDQLLGLVGMMARDARPFVAKSHVGVGGFGMYAASAPGTVANEVAALSAAIADEPIFREGPFIVQEWIASDPTLMRPTFDAVVTEHGVELIGVGGMLIDGCRYQGVAVGDLPLAAETVAKVERVGTAVGQFAAELGFRGWYDVDFVLADSGELYATEVNARRTSPAHAFCALRRWQSVDPSIRCVLADDHVPVGDGRRSWDDVAPVLSAVERDGVRCAASIVRSLHGPYRGVGVVIGAADYEVAARVRETLRRTLC